MLKRWYKGPVQRKTTASPAWKRMLKRDEKPGSAEIKKEFHIKQTSFQQRQCGNCGIERGAGKVSA